MNPLRVGWFLALRQVKRSSIWTTLLIIFIKTAIGPKQNPDSIGVQIVGLDPDAENAVTGIGERLISGEDLKAGEEGYVLLGKNLVEKYTVGSGTISVVVLHGVDVGSRVRISVAGHEGEFIVKGIIMEGIRTFGRPHHYGARRSDRELPIIHNDVMLMVCTKNLYATY